MTIHAVPLKVTPCLRIECKFWLGEDGWQGSCEQPQITVHSGSFEQAKSDMESALGKHIESLLRGQRAPAEHAAKFDPVITKLDCIMKGVEALQQENTVGAEQLRRHEDQLQKHEARIAKLETAPL